ncbi:restriction endonuclease subunit S [Lactococcus lactis]|uniref:Restriction endonuclease subunit S n=1 Tax=Lactococcus lactis TaxID=1358 RepID=A0A443L468_9LACT|nr:restriction endonuclease subunit S [Lactococcus lactis]NYZ59908.1 restriction endonuclease subunit S [Lactococcus lactis]RWR44025.1 restriction endonuclease subunit S [Lactococcus lactis]
MMSKKSPQLRFEGFTDDWEQCKLSDEMTDFIVPMRDKPKEFGGNIPWTRIEDIEGKFLNDSLSKQYVTEETIQKMNLKIIPKDSLIVSSSATFGVVAMVTQDLITNQTFIGLVPREKNTLDYWYSFFQSSEARKYMKLQSAGSTIFYIARDSFEKMPISVPKIDEMIKIGEYFSNLDNLIALHQRKLDLLKEQKKGYLQKMFPKNGAKVPELRFAGFADDWEERKLGDHAKYRRGSFPQPYGNKEWYDGEGAMPFVQVVDVTNKLTLVENTKQKISKLAQSKSVFVPKGKVVVTLQGSIGRVAITQYDSFVDRTLLIFEDYEKETDERFWAYTIQKKFEIEKLKAPGGTIKTITKEALSSFDVHLPKFEEQQKIGSFFKQLDDTIALHQRKLDLLKEQKKGFLQKMFV